MEGDLGRERASSPRCGRGAAAIGGAIRAARIGVATITIAALAAGCAGETDDAAPAAAAVEAKSAPDRVLGRLASTMARADEEDDCSAVGWSNGRSIHRFACPAERRVRRSMRRFEVVDSAVHGTGAVVDYRTGLAEEGATALLLMTADREWAISRFGLLYGRSVGTSDEESREHFDGAVSGYLRAAREQDCDGFIRHVAVYSDDRRTVCREELPRTQVLARALRRSGKPRPRYLGGNERFGFYGLALARPQPLYVTISVLRNSEGATAPALVLNVASGPLEAAPELTDVRGEDATSRGEDDGPVATLLHKKARYAHARIVRSREPAQRPRK